MLFRSERHVFQFRHRGVNTDMKPVKEIELIEEMLKNQTPNYTDAHQRLAWERGFLTGFLARLAQHDIGTRLEIMQKVKQ